MSEKGGALRHQDSLIEKSINLSNNNMAATASPKPGKNLESRTAA